VAGAPGGALRTLSTGRQGNRPSAASPRQALQVDDLAVQLVRVRRRRHIELRVSPEGEVEVRGPWRCSALAASEVVRRHHGWLRRTLSRLQGSPRHRPALVPGARIPLLDESLTLELRAGQRPGARRSGDWLVVTTPGADEATRREVLVRWYRREARDRLTSRLVALAGPLGVTPARVAVRGQRTRWGSCSARGTVSLNWRLLLVPAALADYVLVHELCHLRYLSHSPAFWAMVEGALPDWRERRARLRALGQALPL